MNKGLWLAVSAYLFWGLHPVYWKLLNSISSYEIVAHRVFWSLMFFTVINFFRKDWRRLIEKIIRSTDKKLLVLTSFLIGSNWATYIWAVNSNYVIETSMGYFISPLISVVLGVVFLKERLRSIQWTAILIAATGVIVMTVLYGKLPVISLYLAGTWGLYGMLRKKLHFSSVEGLTIETMLLSVPATIYIGYLTFTNSNSFFTSDISTSMLLIGSGIISGLPLMIFIYASKKIELSLLGILQYIYPTSLFLLGVFAFNEQLNYIKLTGFIFIWIALAVYSIESLVFVRTKPVYTN